ncbi:hypothetical protein H4582DRAFT_2208165 [Lactarius indigo]|nr:hypothetical protein H4582DRAFT_2208165 [Lactarius indigo]
MGGSPGLGQDRDLVSGRERVLTRGPARAPVLAPVLVQGLAPGHDHGRGRATGETVIENALADLALEAEPRVVAGVAVGNASVEERGVREKRERRKNGAVSAAVGAQWGKYGIISESDIFSKEAEFRAWLVEERKMNPERMSKDQNKKEFASFCRGLQYCHVSQRKVNLCHPADETYDAEADMKAHQSSLKRPAVESESYLDKDQLQELRRVQRERVEVGKMKLLGMDVKANMGVRMDGPVVDG